MKKTIIFLVLSAAVFLFVADKSHAQSCGDNAMCISADSACSGQEIMNSCEAGMKCCQYSNLTVPGGSGNTPSVPQTGGNQSSGFANPIGETTIEGVLGRIMNYLKSIAGALAVLFIIVGGVMYMISGGNKEMAERAKKTVLYALVGLVIVLVAPTLYQEIKTLLGGGGMQSISALTLQQIVTNTLRLLLSIAGFLVIIIMIIGAIWMFSAGGDEDRYETGKKTVTHAIIGIIIIVAALIIVNQIKILLGG